MISEKKQELTGQSDADFVAAALAHTADSLNAEEHKAVEAYLKTIFDRAEEAALKNRATFHDVLVLRAENVALASRIAALEAVAKLA